MSFSLYVKLGLQDRDFFFNNSSLGIVSLKMYLVCVFFILLFHYVIYYFVRIISFLSAQISVIVFFLFMSVNYIYIFLSECCSEEVIILVGFHKW